MARYVFYTKLINSRKPIRLLYFHKFPRKSTVDESHTRYEICGEFHNSYFYKFRREIYQIYNIRGKIYQIYSSRHESHTGYEIRGENHKLFKIRQWSAQIGCSCEA